MAVPLGTARPHEQGGGRHRRFGRAFAALADEPEIGHRLVTTSPDVSVSTNLGGWINKMGVFSAEVQPDYLGEGRMLRWHQAPGGHHIELGISEMNLFWMLHALGLGHELHGDALRDGADDPFVCRGLDALTATSTARLRRRRHAGRGHAGAGRWSASEHDQGIDRHRAPGDRRQPAYAQALDWPCVACGASSARRREPVPPVVDPPGRPSAVRQFLERSA